MAQYNLNITVLQAPLSNVSNSTKGNFCFSDASFYHVFAYVIIFVLSLFGNSMTVAVIIKEKLVRKNAHLFLLNMAIADLIVTVVYMPRMVVMMLYGNIWLVTGTFGLVLCRVVPFLHHLAILVSVFTILGATIDRFCAMVFPLRNIMTRTVTRIIVVATWLLSATLRSPYFITPILKSEFCNTNFKALFGGYVQIYTRTLLCIYCSSLVLTVVLYTILIIKLKRSKPPGACSNAAQARKEKASRKLLHMLLVITVCFILCWFVYFFAFDIFKRPLDCSIRFVRLFLAHCNSAINPCVLVVFNSRYRNGYKHCFSKVFPSCKVNSEPYADSVGSTLKRCTFSSV
ncbi:hypothetical protein QZH41_003233 [Actinostola sp. cb2023]|nr:hypothetical protein QZH41_003233 [Actinostola sp. cb2023]